MNNKFVNLLTSRKFLVSVLSIVGVMILAGMGKCSSQEALEFTKWVLGAWVISHAGYEATKAVLARKDPPA